VSAPDAHKKGCERTNSRQQHFEDYTSVYFITAFDLYVEPILLIIYSKLLRALWGRSIGHPNKNFPHSLIKHCPLLPPQLPPAPGLGRPYKQPFPDTVAMRSCMISTVPLGLFAQGTHPNVWVTAPLKLWRHRTQLLSWLSVKPLEREREGRREEHPPFLFCVF